MDSLARTVFSEPGNFGLPTRNCIGTAIGIQGMAVEPSTFFHQRIASRPLPRENDE